MKKSELKTIIKEVLQEWQLDSSAQERARKAVEEAKKSFPNITSKIGDEALIEIAEEAYRGHAESGESGGFYGYHLRGPLLQWLERNL